jgi:hypothetical protein
MYFCIFYLAALFGINLQLNVILFIYLLKPEVGIRDSVNKLFLKRGNFFTRPLYLVDRASFINSLYFVSNLIHL